MLGIEAKAMHMLIAAIILIGKVLASVIALIVVVFAAWWAWGVWARARVKHEPIEYYLGWDGYSHPISLYHKISKEEAEQLHAEGRVYLIGYYNEGRLTRVTKMLRGAMFFDFKYTYYPNGTRKSVRTVNAKKGRVTVREYDRWGRGRPGNPSGFW